MTPRRRSKVKFIVCGIGDYKPGDMPPSSPHDYLGWHAWADVQRKAGIRQIQCSCGKWITPQERSLHVHELPPKRAKVRSQ